jgi:FkbM family methyltransferase
VSLRAGTSDIDVFREVFERRELDLEYGYPDPGLIVDAGAYIGLTTVFLARRFPQATVVAIEPDGSNFELLLRNTRALPNITAIHAALWSESGLDLRLSTSDRKWSTRVGVSGHGPRIRTVTVSDVLEMTGKARLDLLKLDIEGAELEVFAGEGGRWLHRTRWILAELHDFIRPGCSAAFYGALVPRPFVQRIVGEKVFVTLDPSCV